MHRLARPPCAEAAGLHSGAGGGRQLDTGRGVRRAGPGGQTGYQGPGQVSSEQPGAILGFLRET